MGSEQAQCHTMPVHVVHADPYGHASLKRWLKILTEKKWKKKKSLRICKISYLSGIPSQL